MIPFFLASVLIPLVAGSCCFPDKIAGDFYMPETMEAVEYVADYTRGKFYSVPLNKSSEIEWALIDTHAGEQYIKYADGKCRTVKADDPTMFEQCIPSNATKIGHAYFGPKGHLDVTAWRYHIGKIEITAAFSKDCYPVVVNGRFRQASFTSIYVDSTANPSHSQLSNLDRDVSSCTGVDVVG